VKYNWHPVKCAFIDFETQSQCPLDTVHKYVHHPSTRALTCVVKEGDRVHRMGPYLQPQDLELLKQIAAECTMVAHNAPFDAAVWEVVCGLPKSDWYDTLPCARAAGLPGKLDDLGKLLLGRGKDPMGKKLVDMLCILRPGQRAPAVGLAHKLLLDYNARDVELLEAVYNRVHGFGEPAVMDVDRTVNDRGVPVGREYLCKLLEMYWTNAGVQAEAFSELAGDVNPQSHKQMVEHLEQLGFKLDSVGKSALKDFYSDPDSYFVGDGEMDAALDAAREVLELRREVVRVGRGKADAALETLEADDRIREQFVYWGAHTGRWTGRRLQLHNMPQAVKGLDTRRVELSYAAVQAVAASTSEKLGRRVGCADVLNACLRHMVRADSLLVADYGGVEARGTAWVADERKMLALYADPERSVYIDMGSAVFGRPISKKRDPQEYALSKSLVLGCGYGMSGAKFDYTCKTRNINTSTLEAAGMKAAEAVKVYRTTYPRIPQVWKEYHRAVHDCIVHGSAEAGKCVFYMHGLNMHMQLPSGRCIVYRDARVEPRVPGYCKLYGMPEEPVPTVVFSNPRGFAGFLYGSKVCENAVQGICRDLLAHALVCCEQEGLKPVLHVHDEIVCEAPPSKLRRFMEIMSDPPAWAKGFPVLAEGYSGSIWTKDPVGNELVNAQDGRVL
jgi:DNA polymerase bacteriophage-type